MKKMMLALVLCIALSCGVFAEPVLSVGTGGTAPPADLGGMAEDAALGETEESTGAEVLVPCTATAADNFDASMLFVTLKRDFSSPLRVYGEEYFDLQVEGLEFSSVEQVYYYETEEEAARCIRDLDDFHALFKLHLRNPGKQAVLAAIRELEKRDDVLAAAPNHIYMIDDKDETTASEAQNTKNMANANVSAANLSEDMLTDDPLSNRMLKYEIPLTSIDKAWEMSKGSASVRVGIVDDGIDFTHPDLTANCDQTLSADFTGDGRGASFCAGSHGTPVAGVIGAIANNQIGIAGVCWKVKLVSLRVSTVVDGVKQVSAEAMVDAINYAAQNSIPILNVSVGGWEYRASERTAIRNYAGLIVVAAGNDALNLNTYPSYPECYSERNILVVGNSSPNDAVADDSNYGSDHVDLFAPGNHIYSTDTDHDITSVRGSSFSAPLVAGVAALIKSYNPALTTDQIKYCITNNVDKSSAFAGKCTSDGRLNAYNALRQARDMSICDYTTVAGDFDGDGKDDYAAFCGTGDHMDLVKWDADTRFGFGETVVFSDYFSTNGIKGRVVACDFDADGRDEIGALFNYGTFAKLWIFDIGEDGKVLCYVALQTETCDPSRMTNLVFAGDIDGDGREEMGAFYNHGDSVELRVFGVNADGSGKYYSAGMVNYFPGDNVRGRVVAGDFDADGQDEISAFFSYGENEFMRMWVFKITAERTITFRCYGQTGTYDATKINGRVVAGDFDHDGADEVAALYDYGTCVKLWLFKRNPDATMAHHVIYESTYIKGYEATGRMIAGTYSSYSAEEVAILFSYARYNLLGVIGLYEDGTAYYSRYF